GEWEDRPRRGDAGSPQPAGRNRRAARFFLEVDDRFLVVLNRLLDAIELLHRLLAIAADEVALRRIVARAEVRRQRVDARLQRLGEALVAIELRLRVFHARGPVHLIFYGFLGRVLGWRR